MDWEAHFPSLLILMPNLHPIVRGGEMLDIRGEKLPKVQNQCCAYMRGDISVVCMPTDANGSSKDFLVDFNGFSFYHSRQRLSRLFKWGTWKAADLLKTSFFVWGKKTWRGPPSSLSLFWVWRNQFSWLQQNISKLSYWTQIHFYKKLCIERMNWLLSVKISDSPLYREMLLCTRV